MYLEIIEAAIILGTFIYHRWIEDHPTAALSPMLMPSFSEGSALPIIYGTARIRSPVLIWSGNPFVPAGGVGDYSLDMTFVLGVPFFGGQATFSQIWAGDVLMSASVSAFAGEPAGLNRQRLFAHLNTPSGHIGGGAFGAGEFFGGGKQNVGFGPGSVSFGDPVVDGGGVQGGSGGAGETLTCFQMRTSGLDSSVIPGYRNQIVVTLGGGGSSPASESSTNGNRWVIGQSPSLTSYSLAVTSLSTGSPADLGRSLTLDADPMAVLIDLLTSPWGKLGLSSSLIDLPSFNTASATLFSEGHGYSMAVDQRTEASQVIDELLRQVDGVYYQEPTTGKIVVKLIRFDYIIDDLDDINPGNATAPSQGWYTVKGWAEQPNQVRLTYINRASNYQQATIIAQNRAGILANSGRSPIGRIRSVDVNFPGCCDTTLARKLAARELAAVSRPLVKATVKVDRSFYQKRIGDVVTLTWPQLGINKMVMRIARVNRGKPGASAITLDLLRDVFDVSLGAFPPP